MRNATRAVQRTTITSSTAYTKILTGDAASALQNDRKIDQLYLEMKAGATTSVVTLALVPVGTAAAATHDIYNTAGIAADTHLLITNIIVPKGYELYAKTVTSTDSLYATAVYQTVPEGEEFVRNA